MSAISWWEVDDAIRNARNAEADATNAYDRKLTELLEEYAGRRSAAAVLVRQVADLAVGYAADADRRAQAAIEAATAGQRIAIERLEQQLGQARDQGKRLTAALEDKRRFVEERAAEGDEVKVTIGRSLGGWQVADLEEVAYRLRCGGAVDDTPVKVTEWTAAALVPAPNLVPLTRPDAVPAPPPRPDPLPDPVHADEPSRWSPLAAAKALAFVVLAIAVLAGILR